MLTDVAIKALKAREKVYKIADRDGMYAAVTPNGTVSFRYDYRLHGRRETLIIGSYGKDGLTLAVARERCLEARKLVAAGQSPAQEKQRAKRRFESMPTVAMAGQRWLEQARMADSTRAMRKAIYDREILPLWKNRLLVEVTPEDLRWAWLVGARAGARSPSQEAGEEAVRPTIRAGSRSARATACGSCL